MKERPILFSTLMVQAILSGRKTMTRRVVKYSKEFKRWGSSPKMAYDVEMNGSFCHFLVAGDQGWTDGVCCPYGQIGDRIWVRETSCYVMLDHAHDLLEGAKERTQYVYKASVHPDWMEYARERYGYKWTPSIFMPRAACRITLEITNIRVERLQDITEEDAIKEGIRIPVNGIGSGKVLLRLGEKNSALDFLPKGCLSLGSEPITQKQLLYAHYAELWCDINGRESWDSNPWVWVIEFKKL